MDIVYLEVSVLLWNNLNFTDNEGNNETMDHISINWKFYHTFGHEFQSL